MFVFSTEKNESLLFECPHSRQGWYAQLRGKKGKVAVHIGRQNSNLSVILCNSGHFYRGCALNLEFVSHMYLSGLNFDKKHA